MKTVLHILKSLLKGVSALMLVIGLAVRFAPATEAEAAALGPDHSRTDLMMKRFVWAALELAPEATVDFYAERTGLPDTQIRPFLEGVAAGRPLVPPTETAAAAAEPPPPLEGGRRMGPGGALFVSPPPGG